MRVITKYNRWYRWLSAYDPPRCVPHLHEIHLCVKPDLPEPAVSCPGVEYSDVFAIFDAFVCSA